MKLFISLQDKTDKYILIHIISVESSNCKIYCKIIFYKVFKNVSIPRDMAKQEIE